MEPDANNLVELGQGSQKKTIGESGTEFGVLSQTLMGQDIGAGRLLSLSTDAGKLALQRMVEPHATDTTVTDEVPNLNDDSLVVGFPVGLLNERHLFGGVITKVSDGKSEKLGGLKLTDIEPVNVQLMVSKGADDKYSLLMLGCLSKCGEGAALVPLTGIPITAVDEAKGQLVLDLKPLGAELNLIEMLDPDGNFTELKTVASSVTTFDYSLSTLVFDVEVRMVPKKQPVGGGPVPETRFTVRWYLRLGSNLDTSFVSRPATEGVGFFMTARNPVPRIQRFAIPNTVGTQVMTTKYYIKNVPAAHQAAFASAFDAWNKQFTAIIGRPLISYEFVDPNSDKQRLLVPGDIRYKIVEWDKDNLASYGGLGPNIANQATGEIMSANVLIQGPKIVELYSKWFLVNGQAERLMAEGRVMEAQMLLRNTAAQLKPLLAGQDSPIKHRLSLGSQLVFRVPAESVELQDPAGQRDDFEPLPVGLTYEKYMAGYFHEMLTHELGHNVGLRHNFRGNLSYTALAPGKVSHSVMEYLGRNFRYVDDIGSYDTMAISYGYAGKRPTVLGMYCTDEDVADDKTATNSPECSRDDATNDPFGYYLSQVARLVDLVTFKGSAEAPVWKPVDTDKEIKTYFSNIGLYAARATTTGKSWTNFFTGGDRPANPDGVKAYVLAQIKGKLCGPELAAIVAGKGTPEAKAATEANLVDLRARAAKAMESLKVFTDAELSCSL